MFTEETNRLGDEKWKDAYEFFERAVELPPAERLAFSRRAIQDPEVLGLVLELLESEQQKTAGISIPPDACNGNQPAAECAHPGKDFGRFAIKDLLGRGGMGEVYSAHDTELNRTVALKFVSPQNLGSSGHVERLIKEARAASALNHPGIVTVYEVIRSEDSLAIVMELVDGIALRTFCGKPNPAIRVARWGSQIAEALAAAHAGGVVHRDIKPENLMIRPDGYVKVLDFGVAAQIGTEDELAGIPIGTLGYMSPEQIEGKPLTGASDVFALAVVLAELASGRHPFHQDTAALTSQAIKTLDPEWLTAHPSRLDRQLGPLLKSMLAKEPDRRPSAATVADRLASIARGPAVSAWRRWTVPVVVALAVGLGIAAFLLRDQAAPAGAPRILPFTAFEGLERNPSFAPGGDRIAFAWNGPDYNNWDIYVKSIGEDVPHRLTTSPAEDFNPVWSPDGRQIAFLRKTPGSENPLIVIVPANGGPERELTRMAPFIMALTHPMAWWPDGKSLVYRKHPDGREGFGLYRRFLDTGEERRLTAPAPSDTDSQPLPIDDTRLALVRYFGAGRSAVCLALRGKAPQCLEPGELINGLVLQPDRKSLLYATDAAIWRVPLRGDRLGRATRVLEGAFPDLTGDPQGKRLAFTKSYSDLNVWKITPATQKAEKLIASSGEDANADYSPDGEEILFTSTRSGHSELYAALKDGSGVRQLTSLGGFVANAQWSPDGKWIALTALTDDTHHANTYIVPAGGGTPRRLSDDRDPAMAPAWSRDSRAIYYSKGGASLWKIPWNGGTPVLVAKTGARMDPRVSDDGQYLYYMGEGMKGGVRRLDFASGADTVIAGTERAIYRNWALGSGGIYFAEGAAPPVLRFLDLQTHRISRLASLPGKPNIKRRGLAVSPDGSSLLYTSLDTEIGDIMLLEGIR
ncbi:MAG TPA: protein kinase [Bryobacteraceae bacterium]